MVLNPAAGGVFSLPVKVVICSGNPLRGGVSLFSVDRDPGLCIFYEAVNQ